MLFSGCMWIVFLHCVVPSECQETWYFMFKNCAFLLVTCHVPTLHPCMLITKAVILAVYAPTCTCTCSSYKHWCICSGGCTAAQGIQPGRWPKVEYYSQQSASATTIRGQKFTVKQHKTTYRRKKHPTVAGMYYTSWARAYQYAWSMYMYVYM